MRASVAITLVLSGCIRLGFDQGAQTSAPGDRSIDLPSTDGAADLRALARLDQRPSADRAVVIQRDARGPDARKPDSTPPKLDLPPATGPCGQSSWLSGGLVSGTPTLGFCMTPTPITQCQAAAFCNAAEGWTLCTASQYQVVFQSGSPPLSPGWLAACVRDGGAPAAPIDVVCSQCVASAGTAATVSWLCTQKTPDLSTASLHVGVAGYHECRYVGSSSGNTSRQWQAFPSSQTLGGAYCCK